ncbi:MAG: YihY family inner membrane protein [Gammaproteobacteria bacterium]|nr:YihY family inner membrane protein [Gammaproteobacteria bacterium]
MIHFNALYRRLEHFLFGELWRTDVGALSGLRTLFYRTLRLLFVLVRELSSGQLNLRAMSLVYTTLLSLVPLIAVSFSVLKAFGVHNQVEPLLFNLVEPLGAQGQELVATILSFVENMKVGVLGAVGLALLLYTVVSLIQKIEMAFNYVWRTKVTRSLSRRFSDYLSVIMVGPVLVFSALGMTASVMNSTVVQRLIAIEPFGTLVVLLTKLMPFVLIILAFTFVYMFVPNIKVRLRAALVGAMVGGVLWQTTGIVFAAFASSSTKYAAIYSGFAILILFMIWLYLSWLILLVGAQVAYYYQHPEQVRLSNQRQPMSTAFRERLGLLVMYWIARHFEEGELPWNLEALSQQLQVPGDHLDEVLTLFEQHGLLLESGSESPEYLLAFDPERVTVARLLAVLREPGEAQRESEGRCLSRPEVDALMRRLSVALATQLDGMTLKQLVQPSGEVVDTPRP